MNPILRGLHQELEALNLEGKALLAKDTLTEQEKARYAALPGEIDSKKAKIEQAKRLQDSLSGSESFLNGGELRSISSSFDKDADFRSLRATRSRPRFFQLTTESRAEAQKKAYRFGMFVQAALGNRKAIGYCQSNGIPLMAGQSEGNNEDGGALVPAEFENDLIDLREMFGIFRNYARVTPMASDVKNRPRRKGGLTAYFVGGGDTASESKAKWDAIQLTAKKLMVLAKYESELGEDAVVDFGDLLAGEVAYAFAKKEDDCGFNGDGTSAYGGIVGVRSKLFSVYGAGGGTGLVVGSGNSWSELTLGDFDKVLGILPEYADTANAAWYCHKTFYHNVMEKLMFASGGVTAREVARGRRQPVFMGYPVRVSQIMPKTEANSQVSVVFGDLSLAADFGDRRQTTIAFSEHEHFSTDELGVRGTERFDINVHDVGDSSEAGPIVGLVTAAS